MPKPVPVEFFASRDISLYFEASGSGVTHGKIQHPSQPFWSDLLFPSMEVRNKWGAILPPSSLTPQSVNVASVPPAPNNEQPKHAPRLKRTRKNRSYDWEFIFNTFDELIDWHGAPPSPDGGDGWERLADAWQTIQDRYQDHFKAPPPDADHIAKRVKKDRKDSFNALKKQQE